MNTRYGQLFFAFLLTAAAATGAAQSAKALHDGAATEPDDEKKVRMLCQAATLEPKNNEYKKDCEVTKAIKITGDQKNLAIAQDAADAQNKPRTIRYAGYVTGLSPELHAQAKALIDKMNAPPPPPQTVAVERPKPVAPNPGPELIKQASNDFKNGNLQAAKAAATQASSDPATETSANILISQIDHYSNYVAAGKSHESAKQYGQAEQSYSAAQDINRNVAADDLSGSINRVRQLAAVADQKPQTPLSPPPGQQPGKDKTVATNEQQKQPQKTPDQLLDEKKRHLLDEGAQQLRSNHPEVAVLRFQQVLNLDNANAEARHGFDEANRDLLKPEKIEVLLRSAIVAFYASQFEDAETGLNRYLGADGAKKKGVALFYLGATETSLALLDTSSASKRATRQKAAQVNFKQARAAGYQPLEKYVSTKILDVWKSPGL